MNAEWRKAIAAILSGSVVASIFRMVERNSTLILDYLSGILLAILPIGMLYALFYVFTGKGKDTMNTQKYLLALVGIVGFGFLYFVV
jgi:peptidoglycan/LPS O-acetylase OafA/YrhL